MGNVIIAKKLDILLVIVQIVIRKGVDLMEIKRKRLGLFGVLERIMDQQVKKH